jgi:two-component system chemotaxis response regulator CheB
MSAKKIIRVLIVDDSALTRKILCEILSSDAEIEVVGTAMDPYVARTKIKQLNPDVLTLDIEMPKMNGINFLKNLMRLRPMPVVMVSTLTQKGADLALEALGLGAIDYVGKPDAISETSLVDYSEEIISKIKAAASVNSTLDSTINIPRSLPPARTNKSTTSIKKYDGQSIVVIGASTGGTEAIKEIVASLKPDTYSLIVVQHIPRAFSRAFAERINNISALEVCEAKDKQQILPGHVYIAPGDQHLKIARNVNTNLLYCKLDDGEAINRHKPSVDVLFRSACESAGNNAIGILLTGMGSDGARGLKEMHDAGAITIAQDEQSSIIWGMPGEAVKIQAADFILPLHKIADKVTTLMQKCSD